jgi:thiol-disulfide isomerase/thioredoxin
MLKALLLFGMLGAALALGAGCAATRVAGAAEADAQKQPAPKPTAKPADGTEATKPKLADVKPKVTEIKEAELKSLLSAGVARERPLLVNFWATWCGPCREEFPDLVKIREQYGTDKLDFVIVSLDDVSDLDKAVPEFLTEVRATAIPAYLLHAEDDGTAINLVDPAWGGELPATFLYDRAGHLVFNHKGRIQPAELSTAIEQALRAKAETSAQR